MASRPCDGWTHRNYAAARGERHHISRQSDRIRRRGRQPHPALNEARAELKQANAERDQLRQQVAQGSYRQREERGSRVPLALQGQGDQTGGTINQLIANAGWAEKKAPAVGAGHSTAQVADQESPHEEMIAPALVFTKKDRDDDEP